MFRYVFYLLSIFGGASENTPPEFVCTQQSYIAEQPVTDACHSSTIAETGDHTLLAAWFGGSYESAPDVAIWLSRMENGSWSNPVKIADGVINDSVSYPCWNPVLVCTGNTTVHLFYKVGKNPREWWGMHQVSKDNGAHWSSPERLPDGFLGPIKNKPYILENGQLLCPSSTESIDEKTWNIHMELCGKRGKNWRKIAIDNNGYNAIQPCILKHGSRKLQLLARSRENCIVTAWSEDNGLTWSKLTSSGVVNPNSGIDAVTLRNGWHLLVYNPLKSGVNWWEGRQKLVVSLSKDGLEWKDIYTLEDAEKGEFSYPAIIQTSDDRVHITYTSNRTHIGHVVLAPK